MSGMRLAIPYSTIRKAGGRLSDNRDAAIRRPFSLERPFQTDSHLTKRYAERIEEYLLLEHARKISIGEAIFGPPGRVYYFLHHPLFNPNKQGKYRIVLDALFNLQVLLLRFRQESFAVVVVIDACLCFTEPICIATASNKSLSSFGHNLDLAETHIERTLGLPLDLREDT
ncbi:hypothetical protein OUZ56_026528 [Daphnia magna]|uniref:Uncharacterized protein n=1 Tax=Daphnia magna TaxID=35525 RepID=A0ABQ9ZM17_9CRUS|nr:hypothetical protein OUZ56_026528 [Daphnia magna]